MRQLLDVEAPAVVLADDVDLLPRTPAAFMTITIAFRRISALPFQRK